MECMLCAEESEYFGLPECEHKEVCSLCWYRLLIQIKTNSCPVCRNKCETIFIVSDQSLEYQNLSSSSWGESYQGFIKDGHSGLYFESKQELNRLSNYKRLVCRICKDEFKNITEYKKHAKERHAKLLCELCMQSSKRFPAEQNVFDEAELVSHKNSFHKKCNVCAQYFYDASTLVVHIKNSHFFCDICPFEQRVAYLNSQSLEEHYKDKHFYCEMQVCREMKCFVFKKFEDFQDHYRQIHPSCVIPKPKLGFRVRNEEEKCVFEDTPVKGNSSIPLSNNSIDFPALAPSSAAPRAIDYSRVIQSGGPRTVDYSKVIHRGPQNPVKFEYVPQNLVKPQEPKRIRSPPAEEKNSDIPGLRRSSPNLTKQDLLERNIMKFNNSHMTKEELLNFIRNEGIAIDNDLKRKIRDKVLSNSDKEDIIYRLENSYSRKIEEKKVVEEKKVFEGKKVVEEEKKAGFGQLRVVGNCEDLDEKTTEILIENLIMLNSGLINANDYVESMKFIVPRSDIDKAISLIKANLSSQKHLEEILQILNKSLEKKPQSRKPDLSNNRFQDQPPIPKPKPAPVQNFPPLKSQHFTEIEEILTENLAMYKSQIISLSDLIESFKVLVPKSEKDSLYSLVRGSVSNSGEIIERLENYYSNKIGFCEIKVGNEPRANRRGRFRSRRY